MKIKLIQNILNYTKDKNKTEDPAITKNKWRFLLPETRQDQIDRLKKC